MRRVDVPWQRFVVVALLAFALYLASAYGRTIEAAIIGVLLLPSLAAVLLWAYVTFVRGSRNDAG